MNRLNQKVGITPRPGWEKPYRKTGRRFYWKKIRQKFRWIIQKEKD